MRPASAGHASESMPPPPDASPAFAGRSRLPKPASDLNPVSSGLPSPLQQARDVPRLRLLASRELRPSRAVQPPLRFSDTPHPRPCSLALSLSPRPAARSLCCPSPCSFPHPHTAPLPPQAADDSSSGSTAAVRDELPSPWLASACAGIGNPALLNRITIPPCSSAPRFLLLSPPLLTPPPSPPSSALPSPLTAATHSSSFPSFHPSSWPLPLFTPRRSLQASSRRRLCCHRGACPLSWLACLRRCCPPTQRRCAAYHSNRCAAVGPPCAEYLRPIAGFRHPTCFQPTPFNATSTGCGSAVGVSVSFLQRSFFF